MILESSRDKFIEIIEGLAGRGAQAVILGCTEIPLLFEEEQTRVPLVDTTSIHAVKAVEKALG
jgi:aspartate racemase